MGNALSRTATSVDREDGVYYSRIEDVFRPALVAFNAADWERLRRSPQQASLITEYGPVTDAMDVNDDPALGSSRSDSLGADIRDMKGKKSGVAQGAHLFPHNKTCAVAFGPASEMAVGQNLSGDTLLVRTKKRHRLVVGDLETVGSNKRQKRINSGLKHNILNKLKVKGQKEFMDNRPCMLIVPLLSVDETKAWKSGQPYAALVCIGAHRDERGNILDYSAAEVYADVFTELLPLCARDPDLVRAVELLSCFTRGLAHSLVTGDMFHDWDTNAAERQKLEAVQTKLIHAGNRVHVPILNDRRNLFQDFRVAKIQFDATDNSLPNPPDPFLLAVKAAIIWSWRNGEKLLPGCFFPEEDECSECERVQEYADQLYQERIRPSDLSKIAHGLGLESN